MQSTRSQDNLAPDTSALTEAFLNEVSSTSSEEGWKLCASSQSMKVWRKIDESESGIEKIKLIGEIPVPVEVVSEVLYHAAYRLAWDKVIEKLVLLQTDDDTSDNCKREVWYIAGKAPIPGVAPRDFVHLRVSQDFPDGRHLVVETSVPDCVPPKEGYLRAHTFVCAGFLEPVMVPKPPPSPGGQGPLSALFSGWGSEQTTPISTPTSTPTPNSPPERILGCRFSTVSQVDPMGYVPKPLLNWLADKSLADWFNKLTDACLLYQQKKLLPVELSPSPVELSPVEEKRTLVEKKTADKVETTSQESPKANTSPQSRTQLSSM